MTSTSFSDIPLIDPSQLGKAAAVDTALTSLDAMLNGALTINAATVGSNPYTIPYQTGDEPTASKPAIRFVFCSVIGAIGSDFVMYFPSGKQRLFIVQNNTTGGHNVVAKVNGQTGVTIPMGQAFLCYLNGVDVTQPPIQVAAGTEPWEVGNFVDGKPSAGLVVMRFVAARTITFPANFANNQMKLGTAPAATAVFPFTKNGVSAGQASVSTGGVVTWTSTGGAPVVFSAGDVGVFAAPNPQDANLADVAWTFAGTR